MDRERERQIVIQGRAQGKSDEFIKQAVLRDRERRTSAMPQVDNSWKGDLKRGWQGAVQAFDEAVDRAADATVRPTLAGRTLGRLGAGFRFAGDALGSIGEGVVRALPGGTTTSDVMGSVVSGVTSAAKNIPGVQNIKNAYGALPQPVRQTIGDVGNIALGSAGIAGAVTLPNIASGAARTTGKVLAKNAPDIITKDVPTLRAAKVTQGYLEQNTRLKSVGNAFRENTKTITTPEGVKMTVTPVDTLAKYNIAPEVDKGTILMGDYAQGTGALGKIRSTLETIDDELDTLIQGNTRGVPLETLKQKIFDAIDNDATLRRSAKVASTKVKMQTVFDDYEASYGVTLSESEINEIRKVMNKDWNPDTMDTSRLIGDAARDIVYNITPDKKAKALLQEEGKLLAAKKYAEKINNTKVVGGRIGNIAMRTTGAVIGTTLDKMPVVGPVAGMIGGEYLARALQQSQFKSLGAEAKALLQKPFQRSNMTQPSQSAKITPSSASIPINKPLPIESSAENVTNVNTSPQEVMSTPSPATTHQVSQKTSLPNTTTRPLSVAKQELENIKQQIDFAESALSEFPHSSAKELMRFYKKGDKSLSEVNYQALGTDRKSKDLDSMVTELGFKDMDEAQDAIDNYIKARDNLAADKRYYQQLRKEVHSGEDIVSYDTPEYVAATAAEDEAMAALFQKDAMIRRHQGGFAMNPFSKADDLVTEARKYKSAEEFVKAQGDTFYHATTKDGANSIASGGFEARIGDRTLGVSKGKGVWLYRNDPEAAQIFTKNFKNIPTEVIDTRVQGKIYKSTSQSKSIRSLAEDTQLIERLRKEGYVGIEGNELGQKTTFVFDPSKIKTRSQLTDIWKKANAEKDAMVRRHQGGAIKNPFAKKQAIPTQKHKKWTVTYVKDGKKYTMKGMSNENMVDWTRFLESRQIKYKRTIE